MSREAAPLRSGGAAPREEEVPLHTSDGTALRARWFKAPTPEGAVTLAPAMGVPQRFYEHFARALATGGLSCLTFDYRGIGQSAPPTLRGYRASLLDWGTQDLEAALCFLAAHHPGLPQHVIGHSVGGQLVGLAPRAAHLTSALFVAAQSGHWRHWSGRLRAAMFANWYAVTPLLTALRGHLPMKRLGQGEDLPAGIARDWARWGRHRHYVMVEPEARDPRAAFRTFQGPLRAYAISDDAYAPEAAVRALVGFYSGARSEVRRVAPAEVGATRLGHFGFFTPWQRDRLWAEAAGWLLDASRA